MTPVPHPPAARAQAGVTLVELMVAATVLGMAITATVSMLRTGMDMEYRRNLERQAYNLAYAALEQPEYTYPEDFGAIHNTTVTTVLDAGELPVTATTSVTVGDLRTEASWVSHPTTVWRRVDATVQWDLGGTTRTVVATKIIAQVL